MDPKGIEGLLSIIPQTLIATIIGGLCTFLYKTLKLIAERTYEEMIEFNEQIKKKLDSVDEKLAIIERDTYEIKMQLNSFVTVEKHYNSTKAVNRDVSEMRERVARIEGRQP